MFRELIDEYAAGGEKLALAIRGLTREDLLAIPDPAANVGRWSIQQVVLHLMDADLIGADRMKRIIAEDNPTIIGYNEARFAENLYYHEQSAEDAVKIVDLNRKQFAIVLRKLPDGVFDRVGTHNEAGTITLRSELAKYNEHLEHHLSFIHKKRAKMGKEMW